MLIELSLFLTEPSENYALLHYRTSKLAKIQGPARLFL